MKRRTKGDKRKSRNGRGDPHESVGVLEALYKTGRSTGPGGRK